MNSRFHFAADITGRSTDAAMKPHGGGKPASTLPCRLGRYGLRPIRSRSAKSDRYRVSDRRSSRICTDHCILRIVFSNGIERTQFFILLLFGSLLSFLEIARRKLPWLTGRGAREAI